MHDSSRLGQRKSSGLRACGVIGLGVVGIGKRYWGSVILKWLTTDSLRTQDIN
jgi:hypothetical protein